MLRRGVVPFVALTVLILGALTVSGQKPRRVEHLDVGYRWAVVIGIDDYGKSGIPPLRYCVADAELVAKQLVDRCGYEKERVLLLNDKQKGKTLQPNKWNIKHKLEKCISKVAKVDTVLVFFAGHGFVGEGGQGFLATQGCNRENLASTALGIGELREMLSGCKASQKLLVLDCCHAGNARGNIFGVSSAELGESIGAANGLVTLASCQKNELSYEWEAKSHGLFTYFLVEGLLGGADEEGDSNGEVDSDELYKYCHKHVSRTAWDRWKKRQNPVQIISDEMRPKFVVARVMPKVEVTAKVHPAAGVVEHPGTVNGVVMSNDGRYGLSTSHGSAVLWNLTGKQAVKQTLINNPAVRVFGAISHDGRFALTSSSPEGEKAAQLWALATGEAVGPPLEHDDAVRAVAFSPDGRTALTASGREVRLWDVETRQKIGEPLVHNYPVLCAAFNDGGDAVLTGGGIGTDDLRGEVLNGMEGEACLWSVKDRKMIGDPLPRPRPVESVGFGKEGAFFTLSSDHVVWLGHLNGDDPGGKRIVGRHQFALFSPDGSRLVTGVENNKLVRFWDAATGRSVKPSLTHRARVNAAAFTPDGAVIATGSGTMDDGMCELWDSETGLPVSSIRVGKGVSCVAISGDGRKVMTGGWDKAATVWPVDRAGK